MTTELTRPEPTQSQQTPAPASGVDESSTPQDRRPQGLVDEAKRWKAEAETAKATIAKYEAERKAAEEEALRKSGDKDALIADREKKIAELESATRAAELRARRETARALLSAKGMIDPLAQDGALSRVTGEGDFDASAWVEKLTQEHPASFQAQRHAPKPGVGGTVAGTIPAGEVDKAALFSKEPMVAAAAWKAAIDAEARKKLSS